MTIAEKVYCDAQAACGLEVGDYVRVIRKADNREAGWGDVWIARMDNTVGMVGKAVKVSSVGIHVSFASPINEVWIFPYFVLEKTDKPEEKPEHKFMPFDRVLVKNCAESSWKPNFFLCSREYGGYQCAYGVWEQCIPYEGNEHLAGTAGNVK